MSSLFPGDSEAGASRRNVSSLLIVFSGCDELNIVTTITRPLRVNERQASRDVLS